MAAEVEGAPTSSNEASPPFSESAPAPSQPTFKKRVATGKKFRRRERGGTTRDASEATAGVGADRATGEGEEAARDDAAATQEKVARDAKGRDPESKEGKEGKEGVDPSSNSTALVNDTVNDTVNSNSQEHVSGEEEDGSRLDLLNDLREEQRARRRAGGRSVSALMEGPRRKEKNPLVVKGQGVDGVEPEPSASFGLNEAPAGTSKASNISTMIESQFKSGGTGGWGADPDGKDSVKHEQLMDQYVKERMGDAGKGGGSSDKEAEDDNTGGGGERGGMLSEEDRLYTIPEDFKRKVEEAKQEFDTGARHGDEMDGEVGSGAQIAWNTGLAEIALPIEFKLKNMEDTLSARSKMEETRSRRRNAPGENSSVTGSLTANYSHHQREWAMQIRDLQNRQAMAEESQTKQAPTKSGPGIASSNALAAGGGGDQEGRSGGSSNRESGGGSGGGRGATGPGGLKLKHSSDNAVLERFKKRTRRF